MWNWCLMQVSSPLMALIHQCHLSSGQLVLNHRKIRIYKSSTRMTFKSHFCKEIRIFLDYQFILELLKILSPLLSTQSIIKIFLADIDIALKRHIIEKGLYKSHVPFRSYLIVFPRVISLRISDLLEKYINSLLETQTINNE